MVEKDYLYAVYRFEEVFLRMKWYFLVWVIFYKDFYLNYRKYRVYIFS